MRETSGHRHHGPSRLLGWALAAVGVATLVAVVSVPMDVVQQLTFSLAVFVVGLLLRKRGGRLVTLVMVGLSLAASSRYIWWRCTQTLGMGSLVDLTLGFGLIMAELYAFLILVLGFFQVLRPLERKPVPLPDDQEAWPSVDVFIPTYNEPLSVVRCADPFLLARACYHLGNRHVALQVGDGWLRLLDDYVLKAMLDQLGATTESIEAPFQPEHGAYGGGHHHSRAGEEDFNYAPRLHQFGVRL